MYLIYPLSYKNLYFWEEVVILRNSPVKQKSDDSREQMKPKWTYISYLRPQNGHFLQAGMKWSNPLRPEWNGSFHCGRNEMDHFIKMLLKCSECSETWNKAIKFFSPLWHPPTLDILPGCWPRPHVLTFVKVSKNTQINFPFHTESISQHVHQLRSLRWKRWN